MQLLNELSRLEGHVNTPFFAGLALAVGALDCFLLEVFPILSELIAAGTAGRSYRGSSGGKESGGRGGEGIGGRDGEGIGREKITV